jgi:hypothetical protein
VSSPEDTIKAAERFQRAGDLKTARRLAREALEGAGENREIAERAEKLLRASGIDPVAIAVFGLTLCVLLFLIIRYVL